ncbi:MAG: hypothetical protein J1F60_09715 [Oscillospiraceae bacterium]|nr:hypothetical protein [Oscillospiraceae bacterium]
MHEKRKDERKKVASEASTGVRSVGLASVPSPWANTDGIHAVLKVFERGFGGKIFTKIFQPNGTQSFGEAERWS